MVTREFDTAIQHDRQLAVVFEPPVGATVYVDVPPGGADLFTVARYELLLDEWLRLCPDLLTTDTELMTAATTLGEIVRR